MKNLKCILPFFLLGLFLAGCSVDEGPLPSDVEPMAQEVSALKGAKKKHEVPFKSTFEVWTVPFPVEDWPDDGLYHQKLEGIGKATHMGKATLLIPDEGIYFPPGSPISEADNIEVILTGANGDELWFRYTSRVDGSPLGNVGEAGAIIVEDADGEIWGGTGRFEHATGQITYEGVWPFYWVDPPGEGPGEEPYPVFENGICTFNGTIKY